MPILMSGQTIWVDCADSDTQNTNNGSLMLDLDTGSTTTVSSSNTGEQAPQGPKPIVNSAPITRRNIKELSEEEKKQIIEDCCVKLISPQVLSSTYNLSVAAVRALVKDSGQKLPLKYNQKGESSSKRPNSQPNAAANINQIQPVATNSNSNDETITLYPAPDDGRSEPPAQVVRHQLLVTDNKNPNPNNPNQLQLPQKPTPPSAISLPKPVPTKVNLKLLKTLYSTGIP